jgi:hypothetical protein
MDDRTLHNHRRQDHKWNNFKVPVRWSQVEVAPVLNYKHRQEDELELHAFLT